MRRIRCGLLQVLLLVVFSISSAFPEAAYAGTKRHHEGMSEAGTCEKKLKFNDDKAEKSKFRFFRRHKVKKKEGSCVNNATASSDLTSNSYATVGRRSINLLALGFQVEGKIQARHSSLTNDNDLETTFSKIPLLIQRGESSWGLFNPPSFFETGMPPSQQSISVPSNSQEKPCILSVADPFHTRTLYDYIVHAVRDMTEFDKLLPIIENKVKLLVKFGFPEDLKHFPHIINGSVVQNVVQEIVPRLSGFTQVISGIPIPDIETIPLEILQGNGCFVFNYLGLWYSIEKKFALRAVYHLHAYVELYVIGQGWLKKDIFENDNKMVELVFLILMSCIDYMALPEKFRSGPEPMTTFRPTAQEWH